MLAHRLDAGPTLNHPWVDVSRVCRVIPFKVKQQIPVHVITVEISI